MDRVEEVQAEVERMTGSLEVALDRLNQGGHPEDVARFARLHIEAALEGRSRPFALAAQRAESAERARDAALAEVTGLRDRLGRVEALFGEPYVAADALCSVLHPERREMCTGFATEQGFVVSCAECKSLAARIGRDVRAALALPVTGDTEDASPAASPAEQATEGGAK